MKYPKFTVIGDADVGKKLFVHSYLSQTTEHVYVPEVVDINSKNLLLNGTEYKVFLFSTHGQEHQDRLIPLSYPGTHCFILCYSINDETSYKNVEAKWAPSIKRHNANALILLVGTKCDLRNESKEGLLGKEDGEKMKDLIGAKMYLECSAKNLLSLNNVVEEALKLHVKYNVGTVSEKPEANCLIL